MKKNILVFDSGIGGLSILSALQALMPDHNYSYLADNGACPYGEKPDAFLQARIIKLFTKALAIWPADIVVIACNTASTLLLAELRSHFATTFIGVVPAIKPACASSQSKHIALLATKATTSRAYVKQLQADFARGCHVCYLPSPELVRIAEQKMLHHLCVEHNVANVIRKFTDDNSISANIDTVVLGCTHFSFIKDEICHAWPGPITVVDSALAVAKRCQYIVKQTAAIASNALPSQLMLTSNHDSKAMQACLSNYNINQWQLLTLVE